jgi:hypothetical protein
MAMKAWRTNGATIGKSKEVSPEKVFPLDGDEFKDF